jgi:hypothetical protein
LPKGLGLECILPHFLTFSLFFSHPHIPIEITDIRPPIRGRDFLIYKPLNNYCQQKVLGGRELMEECAPKSVFRTVIPALNMEESAG